MRMSIPSFSTIPRRRARRWAAGVVGLVLLGAGLIVGMSRQAVPGVLTGGLTEIHNTSETGTPSSNSPAVRSDRHRGSTGRKMPAKDIENYRWWILEKKLHLDELFRRLDEASQSLAPGEFDDLLFNLGSSRTRYTIPEKAEIQKRFPTDSCVIGGLGSIEELLEFEKHWDGPKRFLWQRIMVFDCVSPKDLERYLGSDLTGPKSEIGTHDDVIAVFRNGVARVVQQEGVTPEEVTQVVEASSAPAKLKEELRKIIKRHVPGVKE